MVSNGLKRPLRKGCLTPKGVATHRLRTTALEYFKLHPDSIEPSKVLQTIYRIYVIGKLTALNVAFI